MKVEFRKKFFKDYEDLPKHIRIKLRPILGKLGLINSLNEVGAIKKLKGFDNFYRLRIADYRIGFQLTGETLIIERVLHRKDIYKEYP